ncbi:MAG: DNA-binding protein HU [Nitrospirae bacterium RIFCSPLOW2_12_42_9]|nr:MAG: DNA-binding protein HU [Nitrospirae bacterium RIFCSPHIGHO2_02_FULL_42_12]OGW57921.1 MAG: DNA-binding protein HU [Nitrospirae bacterium RIFCSPLOW2_12_42_9]
MTKSELIDKIANSAGISRTAANNALNATLDNITRSLKRGQKVTLIGFGTFSVHDRKARTGRNPKTGESIKIPSVRIPKFTAGKALKNSIK